MIHEKLSEAILNLKPGSQFSIAGGDSSKITWHDNTIQPSDSDIQAELDRLDAKDPALKKIATLEAEVTPRRMRDHALGTGGDWLKDKEAEIATERGKL